MISIRNVNKTFRTATGAHAHVVRNLSLEVPEGCLYGLIGPGAAAPPETAPLFETARRHGIAFTLGFAEKTEAGGRTRRFNTTVPTPRRLRGHR